MNTLDRQTEFHKAVTELCKTPYYQLTYPTVTPAEWAESDPTEERLAWVQKELEKGRKSLEEPWRWVKPLVPANYPVSLKFKQWDAAEFELLGTMAGERYLVKFGRPTLEEADQGVDDPIVGVYQHSAPIDSSDRRVPVISLDAFLAQNQSPIEWTDDAPTN